MRAAIFVTLAFAVAPGVASADAGLGRALDDPAQERGVAVRVTSDVAGDEATIDGHLCQTPCTLRLSAGTHRLSLRSGGSTELRLDGHRTYVRGHGRNDAELGLGIALMVAAAGVFVGLAATANTMCWDFSSGGCGPELGPILLGVSVMSMAIGVGLVFDSAASVDVARFAPL